MKKFIIAGAILATVIVAALWLYSKAVKEAPKDDVDIELRRYDNINGTRYTEIFLIAGNGITKNLTAGVYNTLGLNYTNVP